MECATRATGANSSLPLGLRSIEGRGAFRGEIAGWTRLFLFFLREEAVVRWQFGILVKLVFLLWLEERSGLGVVWDRLGFCSKDMWYLWLGVLLLISIFGARTSRWLWDLCQDWCCFLYGFLWRWRTCRWRWELLALGTSGAICQ